jgi:hypothetical protein
MDFAQGRLFGDDNQKDNGDCQETAFERTRGLRLIREEGAAIRFGARLFGSKCLHWLDHRGTLAGEKGSDYGGDGEGAENGDDY